MPNRPVPVTTTDAILCLVLDELQGLRGDLADRGGAPAQPSATPKPGPKKPAGKTKPAPNLDGR